MIVPHPWAGGEVLLPLSYGKGRFGSGHAAHKTPVYDVQLHQRTAYAAIFSRGASLHGLSPAKIHKLHIAIENAEAFVAETIRRLDRAQTDAKKAVA